MNKWVLTAILAAQLTAPLPALAEDGKNNDFHWRADRMEVRIERGSKRRLDIGTNFLHGPKLMTCHSAEGCEISIQSMVATYSVSGVYSICAVVDSVPAEPQCFPQSDIVGNFLQSVRVAKGKHAVQTAVVYGNADGLVGSWQVNYTLYEK